MSHHNISSSAALFSAIFEALFHLSSLNVMKTQNHVIISTKAHVKSTLFFSPSPRALG